jgi:DNA-binding IclR family transcriptional regulator
VGRKPDDDRLTKIYRKFEEHPGRRPGFIARLLGLHRSEVIRALPALEDRGFLLSEDQGGGLWPFRKKAN